MSISVSYQGTSTQALEKTEEAIKNGQSRETGNIGYTRHMTKTNKTKSAVGLVNTSCQFGEVKHGLASALVVRCAEYFDDTKIPTCT